MLSGWILNPGGAQTVNVNCGDSLLTVLALPVVKNQFITQIQFVIFKKYYSKYFLEHLNQDLNQQITHTSHFNFKKAILLKRQFFFDKINPKKLSIKYNKSKFSDNVNSDITKLSHKASIP